MSDTTIPAPLEIPKAAFDAMFEAGDAPMTEYVRAIAAPVVVAELRRFADTLDLCARLSARVDVNRTHLFDAQALRDRADELERREIQ